MTDRLALGLMLSAALLLSGCLGISEEEQAIELERIAVLDRQLERESAESEPDPCASIQYPGNEASSIAASGYYIAVTACLAGAGAAPPAAPASVAIAGIQAEAERQKGQTGIAKSRLWMEGILGVLGIASEQSIARQARKSAERIADRDAAAPDKGSIWVHEGGSVTVHHGDSDSRENYGNPVTTTEDNDTTTTTTTTTATTAPASPAENADPESDAENLDGYRLIVCSARPNPCVPQEFKGHIVDEIEITGGVKYCSTRRHGEDGVWRGYQERC